MFKPFIEKLRRRFCRHSFRYVDYNSSFRKSSVTGNYREEQTGVCRYCGELVFLVGDEMTAEQAVAEHERRGRLYAGAPPCTHEQIVVKAATCAEPSTPLNVDVGLVIRCKACEKSWPADLRVGCVDAWRKA